jgi:glycosyltransferase involved in cell wall biosynthesis
MKFTCTCVIIPTYNNAATLDEVIRAVLPVANALIVVDDGSTDNTAEIVRAYGADVDFISYRPNRGKGYALSRAFDLADDMGYQVAVTMDADGQHLASELPAFLEAASVHEGALIVGSRRLDLPNMRWGSRVANRISNFWFAVQTGICLPDTQTGMRLYPLRRMDGLRPLTKRYEAELELLVRVAWRNIPIVPIPIEVVYPDKGVRVSHFRPVWDFLRISLLNVGLCVVAVVYGLPARLLRRNKL